MGILGDFFVVCFFFSLIFLVFFGDFLVYFFGGNIFVLLWGLFLFVRSFLDYGRLICEHHFNDFFVCFLDHLKNQVNMLLKQHQTIYLFITRVFVFTLLGATVTACAVKKQKIGQPLT